MNYSLVPHWKKRAKHGRDVIVQVNGRRIDGVYDRYLCPVHPKVNQRIKTNWILDGLRLLLPLPS